MKLNSLSVDLRVGERLVLDKGRIVLTLMQKSGQRARIRVEAESAVKIGLPQPNSPVSTDEAPR